MGCEFFIINQAIKGHTEKHYKQIYETLGVNDKIVKKMLILHEIFIPYNTSEVVLRQLNNIQLQNQ